MQNWAVPGAPTDELGLLVRRHRRGAQLSQERLAERAGLGVRTIRNLERGDGQPYSSTVEQVASALELSDSDREELFAAAQRGVETADPTTPAELPAGVANFVGRERELADLDERARGHAREALSLYSRLHMPEPAHLAQLLGSVPSPVP